MQFANIDRYNASIGCNERAMRENEIKTQGKSLKGRRYGFNRARHAKEEKNREERLLRAENASGITAF